MHVVTLFIFYSLISIKRQELFQLIPIMKDKTSCRKRMAFMTMSRLVIMLRALQWYQIDNLISSLDDVSYSTGPY